MKKIIILTLSAGLLLFSSCSKDYLNTYPTESVGPDLAFSTANGADLAIRGCYNSLYGQKYAQDWNGEPSIGLMEDIVANNIHRSNVANTWYSAYYNLSSMTADGGAGSVYHWRYGYTRIKEVNEILSRIDKIETTDPSELALRATVKAEAMALRAYHHYKLAGWYSNPYKAGQPNNQLAVPIKTNVDYEVIPRETLEKVYTFCVEELTAAIALLEGEGKTLDRDRKFYMDKNAMYTLRARIYMIRGEYPKALSDAKKVMEGGYSIFGKSAISNPVWFSEAITNNGSEAIWGVNATPADKLYYFSFYMYQGTNGSSFVKQAPFVMWAPLFNSIPSTDIRKEFYVQDDAKTIAANMKTSTSYYFDGPGTKTPNLKGGFAPNAGTNIFPYQSRKFQTSDTGSTAAGDYIIIRYAEVLYIAAEAAYQIGDMAAAKAYLTEANLPYDNAFVAKDGTELLKQIYAYKSFDLWGEGRGLEDMRRRGTSWDRNEPGGNALSSAATVFEVNASDPANYKYIKWIVPRREMTQSNGVIVQDPVI